MAQLRRDEKAAETFGAAHAHMARQCHTGAGDLLAGHVQCAFNRLGVAQQTLAFGSQHKPAGARFSNSSVPNAASSELMRRDTVV